MGYEVKHYIYLKSDAPYMGTNVPYDRTIGQIMAMLQKHGCDAVAWKQEQGTIVLHGKENKLTIVTLAFQHASHSFMIILPVILQAVKGQPDRLRNDVSARIIHDWVKAQLVMVELGLLNMEQALMQHMALPGPNGPITMSDYVGDHLDELKAGQFAIPMLPPAGGMR